MLCISKSLYDLHQMFRFTPQFFNIIKKKLCKKAMTKKKSLFPNCWLNIMICDSRPKKRMNYVWVPESLIDEWVHKGNTKLDMFPVFVKSLCSKQSKFNFRIQLHLKSELLCRLLTQIATWQSNLTILTSSFKAILKAMSNTVFTESAHWADSV